MQQEPETSETSKTSETLINQSLIKLSLKCEFCYLLHHKDDQKPSVRLMPCKMGDTPNLKKSYLVLCDVHYQFLEDYNKSNKKPQINVESWEDYNRFNERSEIKVEIFLPDVKKAREINIRQNDSVNTQFLIEDKSYCCRKQIASYLATLKTLYKVEGCDAKKSVEKVIEARKQQLIVLQRKFQTYAENKDKMSFKQKFLMTQQIKQLLETKDANSIQIALDRSTINVSRVSALQSSAINSTNA